jgi:hypothetical protein
MSQLLEHDRHDVVDVRLLDQGVHKGDSAKSS